MLMKRHGDRAAFVAADRASELLKSDDIVGWLRVCWVVCAILDLKRTDPGNETVN